MNIDSSELPHLYYIDPYSHNAVSYPEKLEDIEKFTPELVLAWADVTRLETELKNIEKELSDLDSEELSSEEFEEFQGYLSTLKEDVESSLTYSKGEYETLQEELQEYGN